MDQFIYWLDNSDLFSAHAWPWAIVTAVVAFAALTGIVNIARRYGNLHQTLAD